MNRRLKRAALAAYLGLLVLVLAWEAVLAPSTYAPPAFWLTVKAVPLALFLPVLWRGAPKPYVYACLLMLLYLTEGAVLAWSERAGGGASASVFALALSEALLALAFFISAAFYVRATGDAEQHTSAAGGRTP